LRRIGGYGETKWRTPSMRNLLDTASIAQSLDGARLMGCLPYPGRRIFLDPLDYKESRHIIDR
jgi:hypothetical protein